MPEEVLPGVFRVEVPLPGSPLKSINSYFFRAPDRNLIVDTGMNRPECRDALQDAVDTLKFRLDDTDFFITHFHADHLGLIKHFATPSSKVYFSRPEALFIMTMGGPNGFWKSSAVMAQQAGVPAGEIQESLLRHPGRKYVSETYPPFTFVEEGSVLNVADYRLECVATPGHTPCHMCLFERTKKLLLSGDHVLGDITPNISGWSFETNPLDEYMTSLDKVDLLEVELVLPAHRRVFRNFHDRVEELRCHHEVRTAETLSILEQGPQTPYQVATKMAWRIEAESWQQFPVMQKWFAVGEALAHLLYLEGKGRARKEARLVDSSEHPVFFYQPV